MPRKPNTLLRVAVPLSLLLGAIGVAVAVGVNTSNQTPQPTAVDQAPADAATDAPTDAEDTRAVAEVPLPEQDPGDADVPAENPADAPAIDPPIAASEPDTPTPDVAVTPDPVPTDEPATTASTTPSVTITGTELFGLQPRQLADPEAPLRQLGELEETSPFEGVVAFSPRGAGIASLKLNNYFRTVAKEENVELQRERFVPRPNGARIYAVPFALLGVNVNETYVATAAPGVWKQDLVDPGTFEAIIEDVAGRPVLRLVRTFEYAPGTFDLKISQHAENLIDESLSVSWVQTGPADLMKPVSRYGGDKRRIRFGYFLNPQAQAGSGVVVSDTELRGRHKLLGKRDDSGAYAVEAPLWPNTKAINQGHRLAWAAFTDRYFGVAVHPLFDPAAAQANPEIKLLESDATIDRLVLNPAAEASDTVVVTRLTSPRVSVAPGATTSANMGVYAGPLIDDIITADPVAAAMNLEGLVAYNYGGLFSWCTFGPLTELLIGILRFFHGLTGDWAVGIVLLVVVVRTALHPITRWSQIRVRRFGKQMQSAQPKMKKLQERYKPKDSDPPEERKRKQQKLQGEMARLWQEEGINPANALGCLPLLLQSPVWMALWATLFFAAEMRHEPAFWGIFQQMSGGDWKFLADLASPDRAIPLGPLSFTPPFIGGIYGRIESINALPLLMAVLFWFHQKILTPETTGSLSPEQEQMQKTMRIMFPLLMPVFMYTAPSGLTVYFITNSALAIAENKWIIHAAEKQGLLDPEKIKEEKAQKKKARGGKPGFFERLRAAAEEQQRLRAQQAAGPGKRYVQNNAPPKKDAPNRYKKRG